jgi:hypothetical protein
MLRTIGQTPPCLSSKHLKRKEQVGGAVPTLVLVRFLVRADAEAAGESLQQLNRYLLSPFLRLVVFDMGVETPTLVGSPPPTPKPTDRRLLMLNTGTEAIGRVWIRSQLFNLLLVLSPNHQEQTKPSTGACGVYLD